MSRRGSWPAASSRCRSADALGAISVNFKKFGVAIAFTPMVNSEDRITLKIDSEVSELDSANGITVGGLSIPGLKTRQASTTVELPSGGALAIAGLLNDDTRQNIDGVPGLKELPVLGTLFRSRDYIKRETELVVIVQPLMVKTSNRNQLATPTDGLAPASDIKANLLGHLTGSTARPPIASRPASTRVTSVSSSNDRASPPELVT